MPTSFNSGRNNQRNSQPYVSLIIPVYNAEKYLGETLENALSQDLQNIELLCIDDGSTDTSFSILEEYAKHDMRVQIIRQDNKGVGSARNLGINNSKGEFVTFLDADDLFGSPHYLSLLYNAAKQASCSVAAGNFCNYRGESAIEKSFTDRYLDGYTFQQSGIVFYNDYQFDYGFHRFLFKRELFDDNNNRFLPLIYFEDPVFLAKILATAGSFYAEPKAEYYYRCDHKPIRWSTRSVCDLLRGVRINLEFSATHNLAKLHWYTAHHLNEASNYIGIGFEKSFNLENIIHELTLTENALDHDLLCAIEPREKDFTFSLREQIASAQKRDPLSTAFLGTFFQLKRALAPLYHRLRY